MPQSVEIRWNPDALYDIRRSSGVIAQCELYARRIAAVCNEGGVGTYTTSSMQGARAPQGRWRTTVVTADFAAILDNYRHNTMLTALGQASAGG